MGAEEAIGQSQWLLAVLANQNRNSKDHKRYVALLVNVLEYCYYFFFILNKDNYNMDYA